MLAAPRTPESLRALLIDFGIAIAFTYMAWRFNWRLRGMPGREDGPLPASAKWILVVASLAMFISLAFITVVERRRFGLPVF